MTKKGKENRFIFGLKKNLSIFAPPKTEIQ
jgi:hypothetical protein